MTRTDKDRPYWVRAGDRTEPRYAHHYHYNWFRQVEYECDLVDAHDSYENYRESRCGYNLGWRFSMPAPPRWYVNHIYHAPARQEGRLVLREAAKEWNASGSTDLEPEPRQGRNSAKWYYW